MLWETMRRPLPKQLACLNEVGAYLAVLCVFTAKANLRVPSVFDPACISSDTVNSSRRILSAWQFVLVARGPFLQGRYMGQVRHYKMSWHSVANDSAVF